MQHVLLEGQMKLACWSSGRHCGAGGHAQSSLANGQPCLCATDETRSDQTRSAQQELHGAVLAA